MLATEPADTMPVNPISPDRLEHLEVRGRVFAPIRETSDGIACEFRFWFGNRSGQELKSVTFKCSLFDGGHNTIFEKPITITSFPDEDTGYWRTCLPLMRGRLVLGATIPADVVRQSQGYWIEPESAMGYGWGMPEVTSHWFTQIENGPPALVKENIKRFPNLALKADTESGLSAFHLACIWGDVDLAKVFLAAGVSPTETTKIGTQPIHLAASSTVALTEFLLKKGAALDQPNLAGDTPLMFAAKSGNAETVALLLRKGANVNHANAMGERALTNAAFQQSPKAMQALLRFHPELKFFDRRERVSPLHVAAVHNNVAIIDMLIDAGMPVDFCSVQDGFTALDSAVKNGANDAVRELLKRGANPNFETVNSHTALDLSVRYGNREAFDILKPITKKKLDLDFSGDVRLGTKKPKSTPPVGTGV